MKKIIGVTFVVFFLQIGGAKGQSLPPHNPAQPDAVKDIYGNLVYTRPDKMPESGYSLSEYLSKNIHYPDSAIAHNIEGRVLVKFVVNEDGTISNTQLLKSIDKDCDNEALRVVRAMPRWHPGLKDGKPVKVYFTLPIVYKLTD